VDRKNVTAEQKKWRLAKHFPACRVGDRQDPGHGISVDTANIARGLDKDDGDRLIISVALLRGAEE
jgi:hypothetical protein